MDNELAFQVGLLLGGGTVTAMFLAALLFPGLRDMWRDRVRRWKREPDDTLLRALKVLDGKVDSIHVQTIGYSPEITQRILDSLRSDVYKIRAEDRAEIARLRDKIRKMRAEEGESCG